MAKEPRLIEELRAGSPLHYNPNLSDEMGEEMLKAWDATLSTRDEALEEAARVCRAQWEKTRRKTRADPYVLACLNCEEAIRALRSPAEQNAAPQDIGSRTQDAEASSERDTTPAGVAPDRSPGGGAMPGEPKVLRVWRDDPQTFSRTYQEVLAYIDALRQWALRRPAPPAARWVSCSERQPDNDGPVLIWYNQRPHGWRVYLGYYLRILKQWRPDGGNGDFSAQITHWMPLPASPEAGGRG